MNRPQEKESWNREKYCRIYDESFYLFAFLDTKPKKSYFHSITVDDAQDRYVCINNRNNSVVSRTYVFGKERDKKVVYKFSEKCYQRIDGGISEYIFKKIHY